jgi:hypothetical protein
MLAEAADHPRWRNHLLYIGTDAKDWEALQSISHEYYVWPHIIKPIRHWLEVQERYRQLIDLPLARITQFVVIDKLHEICKKPVLPSPAAAHVKLPTEFQRSLVGFMGITETKAAELEDYFTSCCRLIEMTAKARSIRPNDLFMAAKVKKKYRKIFSFQKGETLVFQKAALEKFLRALGFREEVIKYYVE